MCMGVLPLCVYLCTPHGCTALGDIRFPEAGVTEGCKPLHGGRELNPRSLEELLMNSLISALAHMAMPHRATKGVRNLGSEHSNN